MFIELLFLFVITDQFFDGCQQINALSLCLFQICKIYISVYPENLLLYTCFPLVTLFYINSFPRLWCSGQGPQYTPWKVPGKLGVQKIMHLCMISLLHFTINIKVNERSIFFRLNALYIVTDRHQTIYYRCIIIETPHY